MHQVLPKYEIVIISLASPFLVGLYANSELVEEFKSDKKLSDSLQSMIIPLIEKYDISAIYYTSGPGSYMAIKLTYVILKTIEITYDIPFFGVEAFLFNDNKPIKAVATLYFIKEKDTIITKKLDKVEVSSFQLPNVLNHLVLLRDNLPLYVLPII